MILAYVRPFGRHTLGISVNEKYSPFNRVKYISTDARPEDWDWLRLKKVELVRVRVKQVRLGVTLWASIEGLGLHLKEVDFIDTAEVYTFYSR